MDKNYIELYNHLKAEGLTDLSPEEFFEKYKEGENNEELFKHLKSEELTDLDNNAFNQKYFPSKKKDDSEVVTDGSEAVTDTSEVSEYEIPFIQNEQVVVEDNEPITEEESEFLNLNIDPHSMAMSAIGKEPNVDVNTLTSIERDTYGQVYSQYQANAEQQTSIQEKENEKGNNVHKYGVPVENYKLPGLVPSLNDKTTWNPVPSIFGEDGYNFTDDTAVIAEAESILESEHPRAVDEFQKIVNNPKDYNLPADINTATPEQLKEAFKQFYKKNTASKTGKWMSTTLPESGGVSTQKTKVEDYIDLNESYLRKLFDNQVEAAKKRKDKKLKNQGDVARSEEIKNREGNGEITAEDVRTINLSEQTSYDYDNNMNQDEKNYVDAENELKEISEKLKKEDLDEDVKKLLLIDYNNALTKMSNAKVALGGGKEEYLYDVTTGARVEKVAKPYQEDLTKDINKKKQEIKTFEGDVKDAYISAANLEEDHRLWGNQSSRDIEVRDPSFWRMKGFKAVQLENGNFQVQDVSLSEASINPEAILNESVKNEAISWREKNRQNIISREAWKDMALINIDPGKVETEASIATRAGTILAGAGTGALVGGPVGALIGAGVGAMASTAPDRFFEVLGEETIGKELTEKIGISDQKFVDVAIEELGKEGIVLSQSQTDNMNRSFGMEFTEAGAGFMPILGKMALGNKVLGVTGAAGWLKTTIQALNNAKKFKKWNKFRGYLLGATAEEAQMQVYGFHDGTGFGFHTAGKFLPAGKIFKFKGEWARLNKVGNTVFESGLKGTAALEFATHVEAIVEDIKGGKEYNVMLSENYPDVSTVGRRVLLNAAVFSFYGAQNLVGKGKSGMNIKNMEASIKELKEKGYTQEAAEIQSQVDLYYEGKKELPKEEQEVLTKHENGQLELDFDTQLSEKELDARLKEMGGKEVKPEGEVKTEAEVPVSKEEIQNVEKRRREEINIIEEQAVKALDANNVPEINRLIDARKEVNAKYDAELAALREPKAEVKAEAEVKETDTTPETNRLESLEKTLDKRQTEAVALMREKGISQEKITKYIKSKAKENGEGNKLSEQFKGEDIIANPEKHSEAVVVNAYRLLKGKGGAINSGSAERDTRTILKEIKKDIADGLSINSSSYNTGQKRGIREAYEMMLESKAEPKAEVKTKEQKIAEALEGAKEVLKPEPKAEPKTETKVEETKEILLDGTKDIWETKDGYTGNTNKIKKKSKELEKLESNNPEVNKGELSVSGTFQGGYQTIVGKEKNNKDVRGEGINRDKMTFTEYTLKNGDVVYSLANGKHKDPLGRRGYYSVNLTYKKGTKVKLNDVKNLLTEKMNNITTTITGVKPTVKPKAEPKAKEKPKAEPKVKFNPNQKLKTDKTSIVDRPVEGEYIHGAEVGGVNRYLKKLEGKEGYEWFEVKNKDGVWEPVGNNLGNTKGEALKSLKPSKKAKKPIVKKKVSEKEKIKTKKTIKEAAPKIDITDPVSVLKQTKKEKERISSEFRNLLKTGKATQELKDIYKFNIHELNLNIKKLEAEYIDKIGSTNEAKIKTYTNDVITRLTNMKESLKKQGMTFSFVVPGVTPSLLSKALDISIKTVEVTGSVIQGFNKFRTYILKQLKLKELTKEHEKELRDFYNQFTKYTDSKNITQTKEGDFIDLDKMTPKEIKEFKENKGVAFVGADAVFNKDWEGFSYDYPEVYIKTKGSGFALNKGGATKIMERAGKLGIDHVAIVVYPKLQSMYVNPFFKKEIINTIKQNFEKTKGSVSRDAAKIIKQGEINFKEKTRQAKLNKKQYRSSPELEAARVSSSKKEMEKLGIKYDKDKKVVLTKVAERLSREDFNEMAGNVIGIGKLNRDKPVRFGKERMVEHPIYPGEVLFDYYQKLDKPMPFKELVNLSNLKQNYKKGAWLMTQTANFYMDAKTNPVINKLLDISRGVKTQSAPKDLSPVYKAKLQKYIDSIKSFSKDAKKLKAEDLATYIESFKTRKDKFFALPPGVNLVPAVWDGSLSIIANSIRAGKKIKDAIRDGLAYVKRASTNEEYKLFNKNKYEKYILGQYNKGKVLPKKELLNNKVVNLAKTIVEIEGLDINGFVARIKSIDNMFSRYNNKELELLYRESLRDMSVEQMKNFVTETARQTEQTQSQVKKDINKVLEISAEGDMKTATKQTQEILNNIKDKIKQYNRGVSKGKTQSKQEVNNLIKEFDKFLKDSGLGKIMSNQKTLRLTSQIKNAVTLQRAIERIDKLINDKKFREASDYRSEVRKKIQEVTSVVESSQGRKVAKQKYKVTGGKAADLVDRLERINDHVKKSNKSEKYEVEQQEKIELILEKIHDINSLTDAKKDVNRKSQEKELDKLQKELTELEFSQLNNKTTKELEALLKNVTEISLTASTAKEKQRAEDGARFQKTREEVKEQLSGGKKLTTGSKKKAPERAQDYWDFVEDNNLQTVFKKLAVRSKGQYFLENFYKEHVKKSEDAEIKDHQEYITKWTNDVAKIFGVKVETVDIAINKLRLEKDSGIELINKEGVKDKLNEITEMQLLAKWMESKDMANKSNLDNMGWNKENLEKLDKFLTPETKKFGEYLFKEYQKSYDKYNETYKKMFGVSMPTAGEFYSPRFIEGKGGKEINANDVLDNNFNNHVRTANNQHTTKRINNSEPLAYHDASMTFWKYKQTMEKFHHYSNTVRELNAVFGDGKVRDYMREFHGNAYVKVMDYYMDVLSGNFRTKYDAGLGQLVNNLTGGILFLKPAIGIKQTFSTLLYGTQMPTRKFLPGLLKFGQGGIVDIKSGTFWKSRDYAFMDVTRSINPRNAYQKGKIRQGVEKLGKKTGTTKVTDQMIMGGVRWANLMRRFVNPMNSMFIRWGDKVGIGWGGQVYADYQYKQYRKQINKETGKKHTHKEAHDKALNDFEIFAEASQQSSRATNISMIRGSGGDFAKVFTMFQSSQSQVNQISLIALREMKYKKNVKQNAKTFMAAHLVLGGLFALAGNSFKWDDDKQIWGMIMGNVEGTAGLGKVLSIAKNLALGDKGFKGGLSPVIDNMSNAIDYKLKIQEYKDKMDEIRFDVKMKPEKKLEKYLEYKEKISKNKNKLNLILLQFGGVPAKGAVNLYEDIGTVYRNESENPIREILGFESDWTVGRELWDIPQEGFMNPTENDRKIHQLKREQRLITKQAKKADTEERKKLLDEYMKNREKLMKLIINK